MPRRRPRVGQSTADADQWLQTVPPTAPPNNDFLLQYDDNLPGYVVAASNTPLINLLAPSASFVARGWEGLAQPGQITVTKRIPNPTVPRDFESSYSHAHRRWTDIDPNNGEPNGNSGSHHTHRFGLEEFVSAQYDQNDPTKVQWYPIHRH
jgi:hypothetical protein